MLYVICGTEPVARCHGRSAPVLLYVAICLTHSDIVFGKEREGTNIFIFSNEPFERDKVFGTVHVTPGRVWPFAFLPRFGSAKRIRPASWQLKLNHQGKRQRLIKSRAQTSPLTQAPSAPGLDHQAKPPHRTFLLLAFKCALPLGKVSASRHSVCHGTIVSDPLRFGRR
jgi:hypothetical protein